MKATKPQVVLDWANAGDTRVNEPSTAIQEAGFPRGSLAHAARTNWPIKQASGWYGFADDLLVHEPQQNRAHLSATNVRIPEALEDIHTDPGAVPWLSPLPHVTRAERLSPLPLASGPRPWACVATKQIGPLASNLRAIRRDLVVSSVYTADNELSRARAVLTGLEVKIVAANPDAADSIIVEVWNAGPGSYATTPAVRRTYDAASVIEDVITFDAIGFLPWFELYPEQEWYVQVAIKPTASGSNFAAGDTMFEVHRCIPSVRRLYMH